jgi:hypothetical protein
VVKISARLQRKGFEGEEWGRLERKTQQNHWCFCGLEQKQKTVKESTILSIHTQKAEISGGENLAFSLWLGSSMLSSPAV